MNKTSATVLISFIDYGNEQEAGQGIARAIKEGIVKREELFIVSKLWNTFHDKENVKPICKKQLKDYGIDYFDLYIVHFPIALQHVDPSHRYPPSWFDDNGKVQPSKASLAETWKAMEEVHSEGLAKNIGISNYNGALILDLLRYAKTIPATLQIEHHPYLTQEPLVQLCKSLDITITAYSSFGPQSFVELGLSKDTQTLFEVQSVKSIADKHGKTPAQVLLRWATQRGIAVIPKSNNQNRLAQNLDVCSFDLSSDEIKSISALDRNLRFNNPPDVSDHLQYLDDIDSLTFHSTVSPNPSSHKLYAYKGRCQQRKRVKKRLPVMPGHRTCVFIAFDTLRDRT